jgi:hypothetical protein
MTAMGRFPRVGELPQLAATSLSGRPPPRMGTDPNEPVVKCRSLVPAAVKLPAASWYAYASLPKIHGWIFNHLVGSA